MRPDLALLMDDLQLDSISLSRFNDELGVLVKENDRDPFRGVLRAEGPIANSSTPRCASPITTPSARPPPGSWAQNAPDAEVRASNCRALGVPEDVQSQADTATVAHAAARHRYLAGEAQDFSIPERGFFRRGFRRGGNPEWQANVEPVYARNKFETSWETRYIDQSLREDHRTVDALRNRRRNSGVGRIHAPILWFVVWRAA